MGLLGTAGLAAYHTGGALFALATVYLGMPLLLAVPRTSTATIEHRALLETALSVATKAYWVDGRNGDYVNDAKTGTLAGVTVSEGDTYVFFSGTSSATDMVRVNADFHMDDLPEGWITDCLDIKPKAHRGFLKAYMAVRTKLWGKILESVLRIGGSGRIVCCGHSLGGALATIACLDLSCRLDPEDAAKLCCVTFGSPQVGDGLFVQAFDQRIPLSLRLATTYDPVPKVLSAQLPHVKGYVPLPSIPFTSSHDLSAYLWGIKQNPWQNALVIGTPIVFLILVASVIAKSR
jgi:pimeloyl-ACP methyl ester carboxylesterase